MLLRILYTVRKVNLFLRVCAAHGEDKAAARSPTTEVRSDLHKAIALERNRNFFLLGGLGKHDTTLVSLAQTHPQTLLHVPMWDSLAQNRASKPPSKTIEQFQDSPNQTFLINLSFW